MDEILDSFEAENTTERTYELASKGKRFANYIIDIFAYYALSFLLGILLGAFLLSSDNVDFLYEESVELQLLEYLIGILAFLIYYTLTEYFFKGKTLGKLITKTRAVRDDNGRMSFTTVLLRSLSRLVPFEPFSFFGDLPMGWHDTWTSTKVINDENWMG